MSRSTDSPLKPNEFSPSAMFSLKSHPKKPFNSLERNKNSSRRQHLYRTALQLPPIEYFFLKYTKSIQKKRKEHLALYFQRLKASTLPHSSNNSNKFSPPAILLPKPKPIQPINPLDLFWSDILEKTEENVLRYLIDLSSELALERQVDYPETTDFSDTPESSLPLPMKEKAEAIESLVAHSSAQSTAHQDINELTSAPEEPSLPKEPPLSEELSPEFDQAFKENHFPKSSMSEEDRREANQCIQSLYKFLRAWTNSSSATSIRFIPSLQNTTEQIVGISLLLQTLARLPTYRYQPKEEADEEPKISFVCPCGLPCRQGYCINEDISEKSLKSVVEWALDCLNEEGGAEGKPKYSLQSVVKVSMVLAESLQREQYNINIRNRALLENERRERELMAAEEQATFSIIFEEKREKRKRQLMEEEEMKNLLQQSEWEKQFSIIKSLVALGREQMRLNREKAEELWRAKERERLEREQQAQKILSERLRELELMKIEDFHSRPKPITEVALVEEHKLKLRDYQIMKLNYMKAREESLRTWAKIASPDLVDTAIRRFPRSIWYRISHYEVFNLFIEQYVEIFQCTHDLVMRNFPSDHEYFHHWISTNLSQLFTVSQPLSANLVYSFEVDPSLFKESERQSFVLLCKIWSLVLHQNAFSIVRTWKYLLKLKNWRADEDFLTIKDLSSIPHDVAEIAKNSKSYPLLREFNPSMVDYTKIYAHGKSMTVKGRELRDFYHYFFHFIHSIAFYETYPDLPNSHIISKMKKRRGLSVENYKLVEDEASYLSLIQQNDPNLPLSLVSEFHPIKLVEALQSPQIDYNIPVATFDDNIVLDSRVVSLCPLYSVKFSRVIWYLKLYQFKAWEKARIEKIYLIRYKVAEFKRTMALLYHIRLRLYKGAIPLRSQRKKLINYEDITVKALYKIRHEIISTADSLFEGSYFFVVLFLQVFFHKDSPSLANPMSTHSSTSYNAHPNLNISHVLPPDPEPSAHPRGKEKRLLNKPIKTVNTFTRKSGIFTIIYDDFLLSPAASSKAINASLEKKEDFLLKSNLHITRTWKSDYSQDEGDGRKKSRIESYWLDCFNLPGINTVVLEDLFLLPNPPKHPPFHTGVSQFSSTKEAIEHSSKSNPEPRMEKEDFCTDNKRGSINDNLHSKTTAEPSPLKAVPTLQLNFTSSSMAEMPLSGRIDSSRLSNLDPTKSTKNIEYVGTFSRANSASDSLESNTNTTKPTEKTKKVYLPFAELNHLNYNFIGWAEQIIAWDNEIQSWMRTKQDQWKAKNQATLFQMVSSLDPICENMKSSQINTILSSMRASDLLELFYLVPDFMVQLDSSQIFLSSSNFDQMNSPSVLLRYILLEEVDRLLFPNLALSTKNDIFIDLIKNNSVKFKLKVDFQENHIFKFRGLENIDLFTALFTAWHGGSFFGSMNYNPPRSPLALERNEQKVEDFEAIVQNITSVDNYIVPDFDYPMINFFHYMSRDYYLRKRLPTDPDLPHHFPFTVSRIALPFYAPATLLSSIKKEFKLLLEISPRILSSLVLFNITHNFGSRMQSKISFKSSFPADSVHYPYKLLTFWKDTSEVSISSGIKSQLDKFNAIRYRFKKNVITFSYKVRPYSTHQDNFVNKNRSIEAFQFHPEVFESMISKIPIKIYKNAAYLSQRMILHKIRLVHQDHLNREFTLAATKRFFSNLLFTMKTKNDQILSEQKEQVATSPVAPEEVVIREVDKFVFIPPTKNQEEISYHMLHKSMISMTNLFLLFFHPFFSSIDHENLLTKFLMKSQPQESFFENFNKLNPVKHYPISLESRRELNTNPEELLNFVNNGPPDPKAPPSLCFDAEQLTEHTMSKLLIMPRHHLESIKCVCVMDSISSAKSQSRLSTNFLNNIMEVEEEEEDEDLEAKVKKDDNFSFELIKTNEQKLHYFKSYFPSLQLTFSSPKNFNAVGKIQESLNIFWNKFCPWIPTASPTPEDELKVVLSNGDFELLSNGNLRLKHLDYALTTTKDWVQFLEALKSVKEIKALQKYHFKHKGKNSGHLSLLHYAYLVQSLDSTLQFPLLVVKLFHDRLASTHNMLSFCSHVSKNEQMIQTYAANFYLQLRLRSFLAPLIRWSINTYTLNNLLLNITNVVQKSDLIYNVLKLCRIYNISESSIQLHYRMHELFYGPSSVCRSVRFSSLIFTGRIRDLEFARKRDRGAGKSEDSLTGSSDAIDHYIVLVVVFLRKLIDLVNLYQVDQPAEELPKPLTLSNPDYHQQLERSAERLETFLFSLLQIVLELKELQYRLEMAVHDRFLQLTQDLDAETLFTMREDEFQVPPSPLSLPAGLSSFLRLFCSCFCLDEPQIHAQNSLSSSPSGGSNLLDPSSLSSISRDPLLLHCFDISKTPEEDIASTRLHLEQLEAFSDSIKVPGCSPGQTMPPNGVNLWREAQKARLREVREQSQGLLAHMLKDHARTPAQCPRFIHLMRQNLSVNFSPWRQWEASFHHALSGKHKAPPLQKVNNLDFDFSSTFRRLFGKNKDKDKDSDDSTQDLDKSRTTRGDPLVHVLRGINRQIAAMRTHTKELQAGHGSWFNDLR